MKTGKDTEDQLRQQVEYLSRQVAELQQIKEDFEEIVQHATEFIFKLDTEGKFLFVSAEFERMLGFTNDDMVGQHFSYILHPEDIPACLETFRILEMYGRANSAIDFRVKMKPGGFKWVTCSAVCRFDKEGKPSHTIGLAHEVTQLHNLLDDLRASENALRISEGRYRSLFEALSEGIVLIDRSGKMLAVNHSAAKIFGVTRDHLVMMNSFEADCNFIHEDGSEFPVNTHPSWITMHTGRSIKEVVMGVQRRGEAIKWISINTEPVYYSIESSKPDAVVSSFTDITQAKIDREELIRNQRLLAEENEKYLRATKAVARAVVDAQEKERAEVGVELHDNVNQILSTVRLYLDLAVVNENDRISLIKRSAEGLTDAVSEIRKICHSLVPASLTDLGLVASIEDLTESVSVTGKIRVEFYHRGDIEQIEEKSKLVLFRIIQEQVANVLKHAQATKLTIELVTDDNMISLSISDNGRGFDKDCAKTKKGVGLYNISNRAELLNGKMNLITSPGNGCKLNILIPI